MFNEEYCVSYANTKQCIGGEYLIAAILLELVFYVIVFTTGWKFIDVVRDKIRKNRNERRELEMKRNR